MICRLGSGEASIGMRRISARRCTVEGGCSPSLTMMQASPLFCRRASACSCAAGSIALKVHGFGATEDLNPVRMIEVQVPDQARAPTP